jgi:hypothetical protein
LAQGGTEGGDCYRYARGNGNGSFDLPVTTRCRTLGSS